MRGDVSSSGSPPRTGCAQVAAFVLLGVAYVALYYAAFVITAVASIGGGGKSFELLIGLGLCAAIVGAGVGALMLVWLRRAAPGAPWIGSLVAWIVWSLVAAGSPFLIERLWQSSRVGHLFHLPPILTAVASVIGVVVSALVARRGRAKSTDRGE